MRAYKSVMNLELKNKMSLTKGGLEIMNIKLAHGKMIRFAAWSSREQNSS